MGDTPDLDLRGLQQLVSELAALQAELNADWVVSNSLLNEITYIKK